MEKLIQIGLDTKRKLLNEIQILTFKTLIAATRCAWSLGSWCI